MGRFFAGTPTLALQAWPILGAWKKHPGIEKWDMEQIGHLILFHHFLLQVKRPSGEDVSFFFSQII